MRTSHWRRRRHIPVQVSDNRRYLIDQDGKPFFYLGDTAWELFHRLNREDAELYLRDRAAKRFTVIQAVVLAEFGGLDVPNAYGHRPLVDNDPTRPVEAYFEQVDFVVNRADQLGLVDRHAADLGRQVEQEMGARSGNLHARKTPRFTVNSSAGAIGSADHLDPGRRSARGDRAAEGRSCVPWPPG